MHERGNLYLLYSQWKIGRVFGQKRTPQSLNDEKRVCWNNEGTGFTKVHYTPKRAYLP